MVQIVVGGGVTELLFAVQLKASDTISLEDDAPKLSISTKHLRHYLGLHFPVMLVLYDAKNDRLFFTWVHSLFRQASVPELRAWVVQKTASITFRARLVPETAPGIERATREFYEERAPEMARPVELAVSQKTSSASEMAAVERFVGTIVRTSSREALRITPTAQEAMAVLDPTGVVLKFSEHEFRVAIETPADSDTWIDQAVASLIACGVVLLAYRGRARPSLQLITALLMDDKQVPAAVEIALCGWPLPLLYGSWAAPNELVTTCAALLERKSLELGLWLLGAFVFFRDPGELEQRRYQELLVNAAETLPPSPRRATLYYSIANSMRARFDSRRAITYYRRAALDEPSYHQASYWWHELAGCLFLMGRFRCAATCYARSVSLPGSDPHSVPLLADALLRTGRLEEAKQRLAGYLDKVDLPTPMGILLHWFVSTILEQRDDGPPDRGLAKELLRAADKAESAPEREEFWRKAIVADPLAAVPHFNLGLVLSGRGEDKQAAAEFLAAAVCDERDTEAWACAILLLIQSRFSLDLTAAAIAAAQLNWSQVEHQLAVKLGESGNDATQARVFIDSVRALAEQAAWSFSYPSPASFRVGGPAMGLVVEAKATPPGNPRPR